MRVDNDIVHKTSRRGDARCRRGENLEDSRRHLAHGLAHTEVVEDLLGTSEDRVELSESAPKLAESTRRTLNVRWYISMSVRVGNVLRANEATYHGRDLPW